MNRGLRSAKNSSLSCNEIIDDFDDMMADHSPIKVKVLGNLLRLFTRNLRKANAEIGVLS